MAAQPIPLDNLGKGAYVNVEQHRADDCCLQHPTFKWMPLGYLFPKHHPLFPTRDKGGKPLQGSLQQDGGPRGHNQLCQMLLLALKATAMMIYTDPDVSVGDLPRQPVWCQSYGQVKNLTRRDPGWKCHPRKSRAALPLPSQLSCPGT